MVSSELLLLVAQPPGYADAFPVRIKTKGSPDECPYVGFRSPDVAEFYMQDRNLDEHHEIRALDDVRQEGMLADGVNVLVFESIDEVRSAYEDWDAWDADVHTQAI